MSRVDVRIPTHPGLERSGAVSDRLRVSMSEGQFGGHSASMIAACEAAAFVSGFGGYLCYSTTKLTATLDNSATAAYASGGLVFTSNATPTDGDDMGITTLETQTVQAGKLFKCSARVQLSSAGNVGLNFGFVTSGTTEAFTANPTDGVFLQKAKDSASTFTLRAVANGGAAVDQAITLTAVDATDNLLSLEFVCGLSPDGSDSSGGLWIDRVRTPLTAGQLACLYGILHTSPARLSGHLGFRVNGTTQRQATAAYCLFEADR